VTFEGRHRHATAATNEGDPTKSATVRPPTKAKPVERHASHTDIGTTAFVLLSQQLRVLRTPTHSHVLDDASHSDVASTFAFERVDFVAMEGNDVHGILTRLTLPLSFKDEIVMEPLSKIPQPPFLPEAFLNFGAACPKCGALVKPDLWKRHDQDFGPVYPTGTKGEKGAWHQTTVTETCACGTAVNVPLMPTTLTHNIFFYGDESERQTTQFSIECYSLVGGASGVINHLTKALISAKSSLLPGTDPGNWRIHCTELANERKRTRSSMFQSLNETRVHEFFCECAQILKSVEKFSWNVAIFGIRKRLKDKAAESRAKKDVRIQMHIALLSFVIYNATAQKLRPQFVLDATKDVQKYPHIEGWSRDSFLGSRRYLSHEILAHGNDIEPPTFLKPGSHPILELADVHTFHFARNLLKRVTGEANEIPLSNFGKFIYYIAMINSCRVEFISSCDDVPDKYLPRDSKMTGQV
jgi:hypothetical protein